MKTRAQFPRFVTITGALLLFAGCAPTVERRDEPSVSTPPATDPNAAAPARAVAAKVRDRADRTEKAEGKQDLVKDSVTVKSNPQGTPIVEQLGEASWYGKFHHGRKTATGGRFDQHALTAAHPTLPLGTRATVTNLANGKTIDVVINDRGPYVKGRDIDLSKAAAQQLGVTDGKAPVRIEAVVTPAPEVTAAP